MALRSRISNFFHITWLSCKADCFTYVTVLKIFNLLICLNKKKIRILTSCDANTIQLHVLDPYILESGTSYPLQQGKIVKNFVSQNFSGKSFGSRTPAKSETATDWQSNLSDRDETSFSTDLFYEGISKISRAIWMRSGNWILSFLWV